MKRYSDAVLANGAILVSMLVLGCWSLPVRADVEFPVSPNTAQQLRAFTQLSSLKASNTANKTFSFKSTNLPHIQELPNPLGIRSLFVARPQLPIVDIQLTFNAGSARDAEIARNVSGLAARSAQLLQYGTSDLNAQAISRQFSALGAEMNTSAYRDMYVVRLRCPSDPNKMRAAVDLMLHLLKEAQFKTDNAAARLNWQNSAPNSTISAANNPVDALQLQAEAALYRRLYGQHPYGSLVNGTIQSQKNINTRLLKRFQAQFLVAQNMNIAITGQLSTLEAQNLSQHITHTLPQGQAAKAISNAAAAQTLQIQHLDSSSTQATVLWGQLAIQRTDPDYAALLIANQILGDDGFESLLMQRLRQQYGFTYGVRSRLIALQSTGIWQIQYATTDDKLLPSMLQLQHTLKQELRSSLTEQNLAQQKRTLLQRMQLSLSSNAALNAELALIGFYGLPQNALQQFAQQVEQLQLSDVQQALDRHLQPNRAVWVIQSQYWDDAKIRAALTP